ncbi:hypothetical protein CMI39_01660 [Candidatus Pacearchaeota archaeon]|jgi:hypothetical protein|nr:hypothetical protein [Candidatus Pacearchaeota archaeon]|tara:strand:+ start:8441 stop:8863 length:423 start_codon:yes stop_codon:yes gene_type:complete
MNCLLDQELFSLLDVISPTRIGFFESEEDPMSYQGTSFWGPREYYPLPSFEINIAFNEESQTFILLHEILHYRKEYLDPKKYAMCDDKLENKIDNEAIIIFEKDSQIKDYLTRQLKSAKNLIKLHESDNKLKLEGNLQCT